jgi:hypothetical protein
MMPQTDKKNMIIAIALSAAIIFGWQFFFELPKAEKQRAAQEAQQAELAQQQAASGNTITTTTGDHHRQHGHERHGAGKQHRYAADGSPRRPGAEPARGHRRAQGHRLGSLEGRAHR